MKMKCSTLDVDTIASKKLKEAKVLYRFSYLSKLQGL